MADSVPALVVHSNVPFCILGPSSRQMLALRLDPERLVLSPNTFRLQDWRGLAEVFGFGQIDINNFERKDCPTIEILNVWSQRNPQASVGDLLQALQEIERYDILECDELQRAVDRDAVAYHRHIAEVQARPPDPIQVPQVDSTYDEFEPIIVDEVESGRRIHFDAFVCYTAADASFVRDMIHNLEDIHGLRLFITERNMVAGGANFVMLAELIKSRCNKMVIVMSPDYHSSDECKFLTRFAQSLQPGADKRTLIPIIYRPCTIPDILRYIAMLDYTREDAKPWFWQRLASSLRSPTAPPSAILHPFAVGPGFPLPGPFDTTSSYSIPPHPEIPFEPAPSPAAGPDSAAGPSTSTEAVVHMEMTTVSSQFSEVQSSETRETDLANSTPRLRISRRRSLPSHPSIKLPFFKSRKK